MLHSFASLGRLALPLRAWPNSDSRTAYQILQRFAISVLNFFLENLFPFH